MNNYQKVSNTFKRLVILNVFAYITMIVVNFLANYLPINGLTTGEVADLYPNLFTPAGFTFSIWGLIYLLLAVFIYIQVKSIIGRKENELNYVKRISYLFFSSCLLNAGWIIAWHYLQVILSVIIMLVLLINLIVIYKRINNQGNIVEERGGKVTRIAFSVYLGWITVATVANITALLVDLNWNRFGLSEVFWMFVLMVLSTIIVMSFVLKNRDGVYGLVAIWAFAGIIYKRLTVEPVLYIVIVITVICMLVIAYGVIKSLKKR